ncbi:MAG: signal peptidase II [Sphingomonadaceae bacterium]|uniref:signal peptidase II n=1 Tax=Thermaurantiacus sp. TaxID=2820283 RepID=UPI00298F2D23|nr:signal peptidase II [Thermaurantiacus sp.]MCS6986635.1 signal peptidase II [Sphingomonadaceae bacterium]MDW8414104.1 signal peptidase II [Thermaurantiacus sp.]
MKSWPWALAALILLVDQATKFWMVEVVRLPQRLTVPMGPFLSLTWVENPGVSMGLLRWLGEEWRWGLTAITAGIAAAVAWWLKRASAGLDRLGLGLVLGGALGNIVDRIRLGYVIDFVHLHWGAWSFPVFNVADVGISTGAALLLLGMVVPRPEAQLPQGKETR